MAFSFLLTLHFLTVPQEVYLEKGQLPWMLRINGHAIDNYSGKENDPGCLWHCGIAIPDLDFLPLDLLLYQNSKLYFVE